MSTQGWALKQVSPRKEYASGRQVREEVYLVWGYGPETVINDPASVVNDQGQSLPAPGTIAPDGLKLDAYQVVQQDDGTVTATASWSNFGFGRLPGPPIQEQVGYAAWRGTYWVGQIEFPVARRQDIVTTTDDLSYVTETWEPTTFTVEQGAEQVEYVATVQTFGAAERRAIRSQNNTLHLISDGGTAKYFRFQAGDYSQNDDGSWTITYRWVREDGVPALEVTGDQTWDSVSGGTIYRPPTWTALDIQAVLPDWGELVDDAGNLARWTIPPYHMLSLAINPSLPVQDQPRYSIFLPYRLHNDGWRTLPGLQP